MVEKVCWSPPRLFSRDACPHLTPLATPLYWDDQWTRLSAILLMLCQISTKRDTFWLAKEFLRPSLFNAFNISSLVSSSPATFSVINRSIAATTSLAVKTSSSPKTSVHVSSLMAFTGFKIASKYSLHLDRISILIAKNFARRILNGGTGVWFFCQVNDGSFAKMLCLLMHSWNPTDDQTPPMLSLWTSLLPML